MIVRSRQQVRRLKSNLNIIRNQQTVPKYCNEGRVRPSIRMQQQFKKTGDNVRIHIATGERILPFVLPDSSNRFDEHTTSTRFNRIGIDNAIAPGDRPTLRYRNMDLYEKCETNTDLRFFINLFLEGGNNVAKILQRAGASDAEVIRKKCAAYGIESHSKRSQDLTLARIARAHPLHTAKEILRTNSKGILTSNFFKKELPLVMQHQIFSGLIPGTQFTEDLKGIALILNMEISLILESPQKREQMKKKTVKDLVNSSVRYVDEAIGSKRYDDDLKCLCLAEAGILNAKGNGKFELSATTIALMEELPAIRAVFSLPYSDAVRQLKSN